MIVDTIESPLKTPEPMEVQPEIVPETSFYAIAGSSHPQTFWVMGKLQNKEIMVLIEGGSTHNFLDQTVASKCGLPMIRSKNIKVMVANKETMECTRFCQALTINIQGTPITADYYVLPMVVCLIVLGVQWLATLGPI